MKQTPFDHDYFIGYINLVSPQFVKVHFPSSVLLKTFTHLGELLCGGLVGNFVAIEGEKFGFIGKILELSLPEKERLELSEKSFQNKEFHPTGKIEILLSFDLFEPGKVDKGLNSLPTIGAKVFVCSSEFIKPYFKGFGVKEEFRKTAPTINIGTLTYDKSANVEISQQALFGRHCAVVGTTGGGKSYTTSKLVEGIVQNGSKAILIDATGEYAKYDGKIFSNKEITISVNAYFPYSRLTIEDLFVLFRPSGQVQQPILIEAIKSLKIAHCLIRDKEKYKPVENNNVLTFNIKGKTLIVDNGNLVKQNSDKSPYKNMYFKYVDEIEDNGKSNFDINKLALQIKNECYFDNGDRWGDAIDQRAYSNSTSLIMRINGVLGDDSFKKMFGFNVDADAINLIDTLNEFIKGANDKLLLRIGFEKVPFNFQAREILANAMGKFMLNKAREGNFKKCPIVLLVDEAHQFLKKNVKDEYFEMTELNAFDSIAKECRKHGLFLCITTQMPRDIPAGTLSQIGTFIVHRLINHYDKEAIASACSAANKNSLDFLPVLGAGEAILMGVDFPMPIILKVNKPSILPDSETPQFTKRVIRFHH